MTTPLSPAELAWMDATAQANLAATGKATALELVDAAIERVERINPQLNCVIYPRFDKARAEAAARQKHPPGIFHGVPFLLKDLSERVAGEPISWGWKPFKDAGHGAIHFQCRREIPRRRPDR